MLIAPSLLSADFTSFSADFTSFSADFTSLASNVAAVERGGADLVHLDVAVNPTAPVGNLEEIAGDLDSVLMMSVNPGLGGQTFIPPSESKVRAIRQLLDRAGSRAQSAIDGGIDASNAARVVAAEADILVAGQAIFGSDNAERATRDLRAAASPSGAR